MLRKTAVYIRKRFISTYSFVVYIKGRWKWRTKLLSLAIVSKKAFLQGKDGTTRAQYLCLTEILVINQGKIFFMFNPGLIDLSPVGSICWWLQVPSLLQEQTYCQVGEQEKPCPIGQLQVWTARYQLVWSASLLAFWVYEPIMNTPRPHLYRTAVSSSKWKKTMSLVNTSLTHHGDCFEVCPSPGGSNGSNAFVNSFPLNLQWAQACSIRQVHWDAPPPPTPLWMRPILHLPDVRNNSFLSLIGCIPSKRIKGPSIGCAGKIMADDRAKQDTKWSKPMHQRLHDIKIIGLY